MATRSTLFGAGAIAQNADLALVQCPADTTLLLKTVYWLNPTAAEATCYVGIKLPPAATNLVSVLKVPAGTTGRFEGWVALLPGWRIILHFASTAPGSFVCSGTELPGVAGLFAGTLPRSLSPGA